MGTGVELICEEAATCLAVTSGHQQEFRWGITLQRSGLIGSKSVYGQHGAVGREGEIHEGVRSYSD